MVINLTKYHKETFSTVLEVLVLEVRSISRLYPCD